MKGRVHYLIRLLDNADFMVVVCVWFFYGPDF